MVYTFKLAKKIFLLILYVTMVTDSKSENHRGINATVTFRIMQYVLRTNLHANGFVNPKRNWKQYRLVQNFMGEANYIMMGNVKDANWSH